MKRHGFTLMEVLLGLAVLLLISAAAVFSFAALAQGSELEEGAGRMETMLIMARAEAANSGKTVRLAFAEKAGDGQGGQNAAAKIPARPAGAAETKKTDAPDLHCQVMIEADPEKDPGLYEKLRSASWPEMAPADLVRLEAVEITEAAAYGGMRLAEEGQAAEVYITFFPDGASDSARLLLSSRDEKDGRKAEIILDGITGSVRGRFLSRAEWEKEAQKKTLTEGNEENEGSN